MPSGPRTSGVGVGILLSTLWIVVIPLYTYGLIKWRQFRRHFLIAKRFPKITYCLLISAIIEHILSTIVFWLYYHNPHHRLMDSLRSALSAFAFTAFSAILYRGFLLYLRWKQHRHIMNNGDTNSSSSALSRNPSNMNLNLPTSPSSAPSPSSRSPTSPPVTPITPTTLPLQNLTTIRDNPLSSAFLIFIVVGTIAIILSGVIDVEISVLKDGIPLIIWSLAVLIGFLILFTLKYRKVKEGIGLSLETKIIHGVIVFSYILYQFDRYYHQQITQEIAAYWFELATVIWGALPLYLTLLNIYRAEGTLDWKKISANRRSSLLSHLSHNKRSPLSRFPKSDLYGHASSTSDNEVNKNDKNKTKSKLAELDITVPFSLFMEKYDNYKIFAEYLAYCFATENLLFLEKVSIFNEIMNELKENSVEYKEEEENKKKQDKEYIVEIELDGEEEKEEEKEEEEINKPPPPIDITSDSSNTNNKAPIHMSNESSLPSHVDLAKSNSVTIHSLDTSSTTTTDVHSIPSSLSPDSSSIPTMKPNDSISTTTKRNNNSMTMSIKLPKQISIGTLSISTSKPKILRKPKVPQKPLSLIRAISQSNSAKPISSIPRLKFTYLQSIYEEYIKIINDSIVDTTKDMNNDLMALEDYKPGFDLIIHQICDSFVNSNAPNAINIAYEARVKIIELINDRDYFTEWAHYAHFFDEALVGIFQLNIQLYTYRFKAYVDEHGKKTES